MEVVRVHAIKMKLNKCFKFIKNTEYLCILAPNPFFNYASPLMNITTNYCY